MKLVHFAFRYWLSVARMLVMLFYLLKRTAYRHHSQKEEIFCVVVKDWAAKTSALRISSSLEE